MYEEYPWRASDLIQLGYRLAGQATMVRSDDSITNTQSCLMTKHWLTKRIIYYQIRKLSQKMSINFIRYILWGTFRCANSAKNISLKIFVDWLMFFTNLLQCTSKSLFELGQSKLGVASLFFYFIFDFILVSAWTPANYEIPYEIGTV